jgi:hypothetical protein
VQYFLAIAPPVEVVRFAEHVVQSRRKLDQRSKINLGPFGPHAGEYLAPVLLPGAIEMGDKNLSEFFA